MNTYGAIPSVTISNVSPSIYNLNTMFESLNTSSSNYKKYEVFELNEDVLVLSATWKRLRDEKKFQGSIAKLVDTVLFSQIQPEDREQADTIRDYYSKKIMMMRLKGQRLTLFREDLNSFIHGDSKIIREEFFPLVYRLPEFYEYDKAVDDIKIKLDLSNATLPYEKYAGKTGTYKCTHMGHTFRKTKHLKKLEYWFKAQEGECIKIQLDPTNPLLSMWDDVISSKKVLQLKGATKVVQIEDFNHLMLTDWKLMNFV
jgi:hypothetical protein